MQRPKGMKGRVACLSRSREGRSGWRGSGHGTLEDPGQSVKSGASPGRDGSWLLGRAGVITSYVLLSVIT